MKKTVNFELEHLGEHLDRLLDIVIPIVGQMSVEWKNKHFPKSKHHKPTKTDRSILHLVERAHVDIVRVENSIVFELVSPAKYTEYVNEWEQNEVHWSNSETIAHFFDQWVELNQEWFEELMGEHISTLSAELEKVKVWRYK